MVRQHQFAAILRSRGWTFRMLGRWSSVDGRAERPADGAWLEVVRPWDSDDANEKGVWSIVLTGARSAAAAQDVALAEEVAGLEDLPGDDRAAWWPVFAFGPLSNQGKVRHAWLTGRGWACDERFVHAPGGRAVHLGSARVLDDPSREPRANALAHAAAEVGTADRGLQRIVALVLAD